MRRLGYMRFIGERYPTSIRDRLPLLVIFGTKISQGKPDGGTPLAASLEKAKNLFLKDVKKKDTA